MSGVLDGVKEFLPDWPEWYVYKPYRANLNFHMNCGILFFLLRFLSIIAILILPVTEYFPCYVFLAFGQGFGCSSYHDCNADRDNHLYHNFLASRRGRREGFKEG